MNNNINHERARDLELNINPSDKGVLKNVAALGARDAQVLDSIMTYNAIIVTKATRKHDGGNMRECKMEIRHIYTIDSFIQH